jgi:hypothetical protein
MSTSRIEHFSAYSSVLIAPFINLTYVTLADFRIEADLSDFETA